MPNILAISASTMGTKSRLIINHMSHLVPEGLTYDIYDFKDHEMAFADGRDYRDYTGDTSTLIEKILAADAILISTPIYQSSIPGSLKNVFDLLPIDSLRDKPIAIISSAGSDKHFLVPEYQLKPILKYMKADIIDPYVFIHATHFLDNEIISDDIEIRLEELMKLIGDRIEANLKKQQDLDELYDF